VEKFDFGGAASAGQACGIAKHRAAQSLFDLGTFYFNGTGFQVTKSQRSSSTAAPPPVHVQKKTPATVVGGWWLVVAGGGKIIL
jgi:hypothetical protein